MITLKNFLSFFPERNRKLKISNLYKDSLFNNSYIIGGFYLEDESFEESFDKFDSIEILEKKIHYKISVYFSKELTFERRLIIFKFIKQEFKNNTASALIIENIEDTYKVKIEVKSEKNSYEVKFFVKDENV